MMRPNSQLEPPDVQRTLETRRESAPIVGILR